MGKKKKFKTVRALKVKKENILKIGLKANFNYLENKIKKRVEQRLKEGALQEVKTLLKNAYGFNLVSMSACGYRVFQDYFKNNYSQGGLVEKWHQSECSYFKRQLTWFKKDKEIRWFSVDGLNWKNKLVAIVKNWYDDSNATKNRNIL